MKRIRHQSEFEIIEDDNGNSYFKVTNIEEVPLTREIQKHMNKLADKGNPTEEHYKELFLNLGDDKAGSKTLESGANNITKAIKKIERADIDTTTVPIQVFKKFILHSVDTEFTNRKGNKVTVKAPKLSESQKEGIKAVLKYQESSRSNRQVFDRTPLTESRAFKNWFGDSKVVNEDGTPMVVYHGGGFNPDLDTKFDNAGAGGVIDVGVYFSSNRMVAEEYAEAYKESYNEGSEDLVSDNMSEPNKPVEAYLSIKNPYTIKRSRGFSGIEEENRIARSIKNKEKGFENYDGIIIEDSKDGYSEETNQQPQKTFIVINPNQIKSTNNKGTFDPNNPSIVFDRGDPVSSREILFKQLNTRESKVAYRPGIGKVVGTHMK